METILIADDDRNQPTGEERHTNLEEEILDHLRTVIDPEVMVDVVSLGLIRDLTMDASGKARVTFRPSSPVCPLAFQIAIDIQSTLKEIEGVKKSSSKW